MNYINRIEEKIESRVNNEIMGDQKEHKEIEIYNGQIKIELQKEEMS